VIHEFDPWFNFRATEYLVEHGPTAFFNWCASRGSEGLRCLRTHASALAHNRPLPCSCHPRYDDRSWYPLGRPVGTTIFPGLQFTAAGLYHGSRFLGGLGFPVFPLWMARVTLNDVCVYVPAIFGVLTTIATSALATEVTAMFGVASCRSALMRGALVCVRGRSGDAKQERGRDRCGHHGDGAGAPHAVRRGGLRQ